MKLQTQENEKRTKDLLDSTAVKSMESIGNLREKLSQALTAKDVLTKDLEDETKENTTLSLELSRQKALLDETKENLTRVSNARDELSSVSRLSTEEFDKLSAELRAEISKQKILLEENEKKLALAFDSKVKLTEDVTTQKGELSRVSSELRTELSKQRILLQESTDKSDQVSKVKETLAQDLKTQKEESSKLSGEHFTQETLLNQITESLTEVTRTKDQLLHQQKELTETTEYQYTQLFALKPEVQKKQIKERSTLAVELKELEDKKRSLETSVTKLEVRLIELHDMEKLITKRETSAIAEKNKVLAENLALNKIVADLKKRLETFLKEQSGSKNSFNQMQPNLKVQDEGDSGVQEQIEQEQAASPVKQQENGNATTSTVSKKYNVQITSVVMEEVGEEPIAKGNQEGVGRQKPRRHSVCDCHPDQILDVPHKNVAITFAPCALRCPYCGRKSTTSGNLRAHLNRKGCPQSRGVTALSVPAGQRRQGKTMYVNTWLKCGISCLLTCFSSGHSWEPRKRPQKPEQNLQKPEPEVVRHEVIEKEKGGDERDENQTGDGSEVNNIRQRKTADEAPSEETTIEKEGGQVQVSRGEFVEVNDSNFPKTVYPEIPQFPSVEQHAKEPEAVAERVAIEDSDAAKEQGQKEDELENDDLTAKSTTALELIEVPPAPGPITPPPEPNEEPNEESNEEPNNEPSSSSCTRSERPTTPSPKHQALNKKTPESSTRKRPVHLDEEEEVASPSASGSKRRKVEIDRTPSPPTTRKRRRMADESPANGVKRRKRMKPKSRLIEEYEKV